MQDLKLTILAPGYTKSFLWDLLQEGYIERGTSYYHIYEDSYFIWAVRVDLKTREHKIIGRWEV